MSDHAQGNAFQGTNGPDGPSNGPAGGTWRSGGGFDPWPHAYDPYSQPELFRGVLACRVVAFLIDLVVLSLPVMIAVAFIAVFGVVTLGLGWMLFWLVSPFSVIWALIYYGSCVGGRHSATIGMRAMDLQLRTWYGAPGYFVLGAAHAVLFWVLVSTLSPLVLLVGLFNGRRRLAHDFLLGTVVINGSAGAAAFPPMRTV
jgi:uncharacterized RDD family membrane protein YckC